MRQRVGTQLEIDDQRARQCRLGFAGGAGGGSVDAFDVERSAVAGGHPQAAALPAGVRVVDAAVTTKRSGSTRYAIAAGWPRL